MLHKIIFCISVMLLPTLGLAAEQNIKENASQEMMSIMGSMCQSSGQMSLTGNADQDFVAMMIPHHQSGVDVARAYLKEGKDEKIKSMAKKLIEAQTKEISEMKSWQARSSKQDKNNTQKAK